MRRVHCIGPSKVLMVIVAGRRRALVRVPGVEVAPVIPQALLEAARPALLRRLFYYLGGTLLLLKGCGEAAERGRRSPRAESRCPHGAQGGTLPCSVHRSTDFGSEPCKVHRTSPAHGVCLNGSCPQGIGGLCAAYFYLCDLPDAACLGLDNVPLRGVSCH